MAQLDVSTLTALATIIKDETGASQNTAERIGQMFIDVIDSYFNTIDDPLVDGSGTTANGNAVDLGGTQFGDVIIKKADSEEFKVIKADDTGGDWQELILSEIAVELHRLDTTNGWLASFELANLSFTNFLGGATMFARDNDPITKVAGISCLKDGTIMIGDLTNGSNRFDKMFFKHDYSDTWDALSAGEKNRIITDFGYQFENFLSKLTTDPQSVAGVISFIVGSVSAPSITFVGDTNTGIYHPQSDTLAITCGSTELARFVEGVANYIKFNENVGVGVDPLNKLDVSGGTAIGSSYAGISTAPTDGLIVEGNSMIGGTDPSSNFDIKDNTSPNFRFRSGSFSGNSLDTSINPPVTSDTIGLLSPFGASGFQISGFTDSSSSVGMFMAGYSSKTSPVQPHILLSARKYSGTSVQSIGDSIQAFAVANLSTILFQLLGDGSAEFKGCIIQNELSADPPDPSEGQSVKWMSDGTGSGDDGDIMMKITAGGTTKTTTLVDFSAI